jgi:hypothetical protein
MALLNMGIIGLSRYYGANATSGLTAAFAYSAGEETR